MKILTYNGGNTTVQFRNKGECVFIKHTFPNRDKTSKFYCGLMSIELTFRDSKLYMVVDGNYDGCKELSYDRNKTLKENVEFHLKRILNFFEFI